MKLSRRSLLRVVAGAAAFAAHARFAWAQDYPARPVHIIVGFPAGGAADLTARLIGQWLSDRLGQQFVVETRPGAGTLAVTTATRQEVLPDVPTVAEFVPGYEASGWFGIGAPKATPTEIVDKLNREINTALADPKMRSRITDSGGLVLPGSPSDLGKLIAAETAKWGKVVQTASITLD